MSDFTKDAERNDFNVGGSETWRKREDLREFVGSEVEVLAIYGRKRRFRVGQDSDGNLIELRLNSHEWIFCESEYATIRLIQLPQRKENTIAKRDDAEQEILAALCNMLEWAKGNRGRKDLNPYGVPEVERALKVLAKRWDRDDWLDVDQAKEYKVYVKKEVS